MSGIAAVIVVSVFVLTSAVLIAAAFGLVRQVKTLSANLRALQGRLEPILVELNREAGVTERELARLGQAAARLRKS